MKEDQKSSILEQLTNLINRVKRKYKHPNIIIYGDFNTNQQWNIQHIENMTKLKWSDLNKNIPTRSQKRNNAILNNTLDYFLSSTKINEINTIKTELPDHYPLIAKIQWNQQPKQIKAYIHRSDFKINSEKINKLINSEWPESSSSDTKKIFKEKLQIRPVIKIQNKANAIFKNKTNWEDKELKLKDLRSTEFKEFIKSIDMNNLIDKRTFYKMMNSLLKYKIKGKIIKGIMIKDTIVYGTDKKTIIKNYFEQLYNSNIKDTKINDNGIYDYTWNTTRAITNLSKSNAAGIDNIPSKIFKQKEDSPLLLKIKDKFSTWIQQSSIPSYMMLGKLILLSNSKDDCPTIDKTRPIIVLPAITKFFESSILHTLENITKSNQFWNKQRGFTKGKSTLDNIRDVIALGKAMKKEKKSKDSPWFVFFDFHKAYDSVPRDKLIQKLTDLNTPSNIILLISNMLKDFKIDIEGETIPTFRGLIQGSVLSPILFNLFVNDLLVEYETAKIESRAYADDIICIWSNLTQAKSAIFIMKNWCLQNRMKINKDKSGILRILKRKGKIRKIENCLDIPEVDSYKYLGITLNQSLQLDSHHAYIKTKISELKRKIFLLKPSLFILKSRITLYQSIIVPKLNYAWNALYENDQIGKSKLKNGLYQWLKLLLNIRGNVKKDKIFTILGLETEEIPNFKRRKLNITENLSIKSIKLRVDCLFSRYHERLCKWNHRISSEDIINACSKVNEWRNKWSHIFNALNLNLKYSLLKLGNKIRIFSHNPKWLQWW